VQEYREQHPPEFRVDARLGRLTLLQVVGMLVVVAGMSITILVAVLARPPFWRTASFLLAFGAVGAEVLFGVRRRFRRALAYAGRPRWRRSDVSVPISQDQTVQALAPVQGLTGPFWTWDNSTEIAMLLRILPAPTTCVDDLRAQTLQLRFAEALRRCAQAGINPSIYVDVEPDLQRPELERQRKQALRLPAQSGLRPLLLARLAHHERLAQTFARTVSYHLRLVADVTQIPGIERLGDNVTEAAMQHLRDVAAEIAEDLRPSGAQVQYVGPEGIRDIVMRQLDPAGWRASEPARNTDWAYPVDGQPSVLQAPPASELPAAEPAGVEEPESVPVTATEDLPKPVEIAQKPAPAQPADLEPEQPAVVANPPAPDLLKILLGRRPSQPVPDQAPASPAEVPTRKAAEPRAESIQARPLATREVLAVVGATHRVGTSTVALNLALALRGRGNSVAIVALDGDNAIGRWHGRNALVSTQHWVEGSSDLWVPLPRGITLVAGPTRLPGVPYPAIPDEAIARVIGTIRREIDVVILDLGCEINSESRVALTHATGLLVVMGPDPDQVEAAELRREQAAAAGLGDGCMAMILNRAAGGQKPAGRTKPALVLPEDPTVAECAQVRTAPVVAAPETPWAQALITWAQHIEEG
jgi:MinD-like ATPase involved in chromosome partitioning or flagellar assembly